MGDRQMTSGKLTRQKQEAENELYYDSRRDEELEYNAKKSAHRAAVEAQRKWDKMLHGCQFESYVIKGSFANHVKMV
mgnify:FL=1